MKIFKRATPLSAKGAFFALSLLMFFFSAQVSLTIYVDSSYVQYSVKNTPSLSSMSIWSSPENTVGTLYTFASLITLLALYFAPRILRKHGNYRWTLTLLFVHTILLLGLSLFDSAWLIIPLFVVEAALISTLYFNFDVFLERFSSDETTGSVRGLFMVIGSAAWLLPPFFAGKIVDAFGFQPVYMLAAAIMVPTIFITMYWFSDFHDLVYDDLPLSISPDKKVKNPDIRNILIANFFLQFFYSWMVIYLPLYFHNHLGISFADIGLITMVALFAFIIYPYPLGWLADKYVGEKELLIFGFLVMAVSSALIPLLAGAKVSLLLWAILLFAGRSGAAIVESMSETYFFKKIDGRNAGLIGNFRRTRPLAFIAAPITASVLLQFNIVTMVQLFYILSGIMIFAAYFPLRLVDTK